MNNDKIGKEYKIIPGHRYKTPLPLQLQEVKSLEEKVNAHLAKMGFVWN